MADFTDLVESEFWRKKFRKAFESRDVTKSGYVSREDFELILDRHTTPDCQNRSQNIVTILASRIQAPR